MKRKIIFYYLMTLIKYLKLFGGETNEGTGVYGDASTHQREEEKEPSA